MRGVLGERMAFLMSRSLRHFCPMGLSITSCWTRLGSLDTCRGIVTVPQGLLFIWGQETEGKRRENVPVLPLKGFHHLANIRPDGSVPKLFHGKKKTPSKITHSISTSAYAAHSFKHIVSGRYGKATWSCVLRGKCKRAHGECDHVSGRSAYKLMVCGCMYVSESPQLSHGLYSPLGLSHIFGTSPSAWLEERGHEESHNRQLSPRENQPHYPWCLGVQMCALAPSFEKGEYREIFTSVRPTQGNKESKISVLGLKSLQSAGYLSDKP